MLKKEQTLWRDKAGRLKGKEPRILQGEGKNGKEGTAQEAAAAPKSEPNNFGKKTA